MDCAWFCKNKNQLLCSDTPIKAETLSRFEKAYKIGCALIGIDASRACLGRDRSLDNGMAFVLEGEVKLIYKQPLVYNQYVTIIKSIKEKNYQEIRANIGGTIDWIEVDNHIIHVKCFVDWTQQQQQPPAYHNIVIGNDQIIHSVGFLSMLLNCKDFDVDNRPIPIFSTRLCSTIVAS